VHPNNQEKQSCIVQNQGYRSKQGCINQSLNRLRTWVGPAGGVNRSRWRPTYVVSVQRTREAS
jgi:hypothetical protein